MYRSRIERNAASVVLIFTANVRELQPVNVTLRGCQPPGSWPDFGSASSGWKLHPGFIAIILNLYMYWMLKTIAERSKRYTGTFRAPCLREVLRRCRSAQRVTISACWQLSLDGPCWSRILLLVGPSAPARSGQLAHRSGRLPELLSPCNSAHGDSQRTHPWVSTPSRMPWLRDCASPLSAHDDYIYLDPRPV